MDAHAALGAAVKAELDQLKIWSRQALGAGQGERETDARDLAFAALAAAYGLVTLASTASLMSQQKSSSEISTNTGLAPIISTAFAVAG